MQDVCEELEAKRGSLCEMMLTEVLNWSKHVGPAFEVSPRSEVVEPSRYAKISNLDKLMT